MYTAILSCNLDFFDRSLINNSKLLLNKLNLYRYDVIIIIIIVIIIIIISKRDDNLRPRTVKLSVAIVSGKLNFIKSNNLNREIAVCMKDCSIGERGDGSESIEFLIISIALNFRM